MAPEVGNALIRTSWTQVASFAFEPLPPQFGSKLPSAMLILIPSKGQKTRTPLAASFSLL